MPEIQIVNEREAESNHFVLREHAIIIKDICRQMQCFVTIRKSGEHTIRRLRQHYAAKPHDIYDKSLKPGSLSGLTLGDDVERVITDHCLGLVGHWEGPKDAKRPTGVRTMLAWNLVEGGGGLEWQRTDAGRNDENFVSFADIDRAGGLPTFDTYTGDYDVHDILLKRAGTTFYRALSTPKKVKKPNEFRFDNKSETKAKSFIRDGFSIGVENLINIRINRQRLNWRSRMGQDDFAHLIQHGPQHGFASFVFNREKNNWVHKLVDFDHPIIAFYPSGHIKILHTINAIKAMYRAANCTISPWWEEQRKRVAALAAYERTVGRTEDDVHKLLKRSVTGDGFRKGFYPIWKELRDQYLSVEEKLAVMPESRVSTVRQTLVKQAKILHDLLSHNFSG